MSDELKTLLSRVNKAIARAKTREKALFRFGRPIFDWETHKEALAEIKDERDAVLRQVEHRIAEIEKEATEEIEAAKHFDRGSVLSSTERREAAEMLPLIEREVSAMGAGENLARRIAVITETGGVPNRYAWWLAVVDLRSRLLRRTEGAGGAAPTLVFATQLDALDRSLFEEHFSGLVADAESRRDEARQVGERAYSGRHDATDFATSQRYAADDFFARRKYENGGRPLATGAGSGRPTGEIAGSRGRSDDAGGEGEGEGEGEA